LSYRLVAGEQARGWTAAEQRAVTHLQLVRAPVSGERQPTRDDPGDPGTYEFRLFPNKSCTIAAQSPAITVAP
jgi:hypothetical protein